MPPRGASNWRRPYTSIYNDNYRYGTGLYNDTLTDIEKRYSDSMSRTQLRSDRPDLAFQTFAGSTLTSSPAPGDNKEGTAISRQLSRQASRSSPVRDLQRSATFESRLSSTLQSASAVLDEAVQEAIDVRAEQRRLRRQQETASPRPKSLYEDASIWTSKSIKEDSEDLDVGRSKRKVGIMGSSSSGGSHWREKSRVLQDQVEALESSMSSCNNKLSSELNSLKSKCHNEISDLGRSVELTGEQSNDLQKLCKRQAHQLLELQSAYDDAQRNIQDALEEMNLYQNKCRSLKKEMDRLREELDQVMTKRYKEKDI